MPSALLQRVAKSAVKVRKSWPEDTERPVSTQQFYVWHRKALKHPAYAAIVAKAEELDLPKMFCSDLDVDRIFISSEPTSARLLWGCRPTGTQIVRLDFPDSWVDCEPGYCTTMFESGGRNYPDQTWFYWNGEALAPITIAEGDVLCRDADRAWEQDPRRRRSEGEGD